MRRGRKPQPTKLLRLRGAYRHDRHGDRLEPLPTGSLLEPPGWLTEAQRQRFNEILANAPKNLLRRWDGPTVAGFVVAESVVIEANKARTEGHLLDSARGGVPTVAALLKVQSRFLPLMKQFGELLGFFIAETVVIEANKARAEGQLLDRTERGALTVAALLKVQRSYLPLMKQFGELLGFSPVARSTLTIEDTAEDEDDPDWARWEWIKVAAERHPEGSPEKEAQRRRLDYLDSIMYPRPARSRRKRAEANLAEVEPTTKQPS